MAWCESNTYVSSILMAQCKSDINLSFYLNGTVQKVSETDKHKTVHAMAIKTRYILKALNSISSKH